MLPDKRAIKREGGQSSLMLIKIFLTVVLNVVMTVVLSALTF